MDEKITRAIVNTEKFVESVIELNEFAETPVCAGFEYDFNIHDILKGAA